MARTLIGQFGEDLTPRVQRVAQLTLLGYTQREIAKQLSVGRTTVQRDAAERTQLISKNLHNRVMEKLEIHRKESAIRATEARMNRRREDAGN